MILTTWKLARALPDIANKNGCRLNSKYWSLLINNGIMEYLVTGPLGEKATHLHVLVNGSILFRCYHYNLYFSWCMNWSDLNDIEKASKCTISCKVTYNDCLHSFTIQFMTMVIIWLYALYGDNVRLKNYWKIIKCRKQIFTSIKSNFNSL